jgi:2-polyprenyl-3-methyl-5-hydroxy-6-metoxy-1,4-benzoquinol methylase
MDFLNNKQACIDLFVKQLNQLNIAGLTMAPYCKTYLQHLVQHGRYYTEIYARLLSLLLNNNHLTPNKTILVDYGAGNGLLGIFAKYCGFYKVYSNDIDADCTQAAQTLANALQVPIDDYITGDTESLLNYFSCKSAPNAIAGTDVIEHIYNLPAFLTQLKKLNPQVTVVFSTGANAHNWWKKRALIQQQIQDEHEGTIAADNSLAAATNIPAFLQLRTQIINTTAPALAAAEVSLLACATRGLVQHDIENAVRQYQATGQLPAPPAHPTNTCHPITGSWSERLLTISQYQQIFKEAGFSMNCYPGFYNSFEKNSKSVALKWMNLFAGKKLAPFIIITGY